MYIPPKFSIQDIQTIRYFIAQNSFGILLSLDEDEFHDTHIPFVLSKEGTSLYGHVAKANPQWKAWQKNPKVKVIFHGPHAYVSPTYYISENQVPTWNYTAISITGDVEIIEEVKEQHQVIQELVEKNESFQEIPWKFENDNEKILPMFNAIVCFKIKIDKIKAKYKLSQNKSIEDQRSVVQHLKEKGTPMDLEIAQLMEQNLS